MCGRYYEVVGGMRWRYPVWEVLCGRCVGCMRWEVCRCVGGMLEVMGGIMRCGS